MPETKRIPAELPSNDQVLAAIERAACHSGRDEPGQSLGTIKEHLGLLHTGATTIRLRPTLQALHTADLIEPLRHDRSVMWELTAKGRRRLDSVRSEISPLPE